MSGISKSQMKDRIPRSHGLEDTFVSKDRVSMRLPARSSEQTEMPLPFAPINGELARERSLGNEDPRREGHTSKSPDLTIGWTWRLDHRVRYPGREGHGHMKLRGEIRFLGQLRGPNSSCS